MSFNSSSNTNNNTGPSSEELENPTFAIGKGITNLDLRLVDFTFKDLVEYIEGYSDCTIKNKKSQYYFVNTGSFINPVRRNENMHPSVMCHAVIVDGDGPNNNLPLCSPETVHLALKSLGYNHMVYTSFSHSLGAPKWRAVIECICTPEQVASNAKKIVAICNNNGCNIEYASENNTKGRAWFFGGMNEPELYESYSFFDGVAVIGELVHVVKVPKGKRDTELTAYIWELCRSSETPTNIFTKACAFRDEFENPEDFPDDLVSKKIVVTIKKLERNSDELFGLPLDPKKNTIAPTFTNVCAALEVMWSDDFAGDKYVVGFDEFKCNVVYHRGDGVWLTYKDDIDLELRLLLVKYRFQEVKKEIMADARDLVASRHRFDSAQEWILGLTWDGVPRVSKFCHTHFGGFDCEYMTAVSEYMWTAMAGRVMVPGIQADMMVVLQGLSQGERKTTAIRAMAPSDDVFCEVSFNMKDDEFGRLMKGKLIAEVAELKGINSRDSEHIKAVMSRSIEETRSLYKNFFIQYLRRCLLFGTTNQEQFLNDQTGNRRYLPFITTFCDRDSISRDRDQLWAEALVMFKNNGVMWEDAQRLAPFEHRKATIESPLEHDIAVWLSIEANQLIVKKEGLSCMLLRDHLNITGDPQRVSTLIGTALVALGYNKKQMTINGIRARYYTRV